MEVKPVESHPKLQSQPIFNLGLVQEILGDLLSQGEYTIYLLFRVGVSTPLTLDTIMALRPKHFLEKEENFQFYLFGELPNEIYNFLKSQPREKKLFSEIAHQALREKLIGYGIQDFDRETLRKTFGYHYFQKTKDIRKVEKVLDMKPETFTFKYIGYFDETYYCFYCTKGCLW